MSNLFSFTAIRDAEKASGETRDSLGIVTHSDGLTSQWFQRAKSAAKIKDVAALEELALSYLSSQTALQNFKQLSPVLNTVIRYLSSKGVKAKSAEINGLIRMNDLADYFQGQKPRAAEEKNNIEDTMLALSIIGKMGHPDHIDYQLALRAHAVLSSMHAQKGNIKQLNLNSFISMPILLPAYRFNKCTKKYEETGPFPFLKLNEQQKTATTKPNPDGTILERECDCDCGDEPCIEQNKCCAPLFFYIADHFTVKDELQCYEYGQLAYIENIMAGEERDRFHSIKETDEINTSSTLETTRKYERDLTINERFSYSNALQETIKNEHKFNINAGVRAFWGEGSAKEGKDGSSKISWKGLGGIVSVNAGASYSYNKDEVKKISRQYSREITDRASSLLETKISESYSRMRKIALEETNDRKFKNTAKDHHIIGQYFFVDQKNKAQLINHGKRLIFDFVVPEPMTLYKEMMRRAKTGFHKEEPPKPKFLAHEILLEESSNPLSYVSLIREWELVDVAVLPDKDIRIPFTIDSNVIVKGPNQALTHLIQVGKVPQGYNGRQLVVDLRAIDFKGYTAPPDGDGQTTLRIEVFADGKSSGNGNYISTGDPNHLEQKIYWDFDFPFDATQNSVVQAVIFAKSCVGIAGSGYMRCDLSAQSVQDWKLDIYEKVMASYQEKHRLYLEEKAKYEKELEEKFPFGRNPEQNRLIEFTELKRLGISYLSCQFFDRFTAMKHNVKPCGYPEMDLEQAYKDGLFIQFFEQVLDWNLMSYIFYGYYWNGHKCEWPELLKLTNDDPLLEQSLKSGAARLQVPVREGSEWPALYWAAFGDVWMGTGHPPLPNTPYYVSVAQEIKEQKQCYYKPRPGTLAVNVGDPFVILNYGPADIPEYPALISADIDREIIINCETYRIVNITAGSSPSEWRIDLDREYKRKGCCGCDEPQSFPNLKYETGGIFAGAPFEINIPTNLVTLRNTTVDGQPTISDCLPCYPIEKCKP